MAERSVDMPDPFDRLLGALDGLPDVVRTKPSTIRTMPLLGVGGSTLHIVQTVRRQLTRTNKKGEDVSYSEDTIFLEVVRGGDQTPIRVALPAEVADTIARQREALTGKTRSRAARKQAAERKERGAVPFARKVRA